MIKSHVLTSCVTVLNWKDQYDCFWILGEIYPNRQFGTCFFAYCFVQVTQCDTQNKKAAKPRCVKGVLALEYH